MTNWTWKDIDRALQALAAAHPARTDPDIQAKFLNCNGGWHPPVNVADVIQSRRRFEDKTPEDKPRLGTENRA